MSRSCWRSDRVLRLISSHCACWEVGRKCREGLTCTYVKETYPRRDSSVSQRDEQRSLQQGIYLHPLCASFFFLFSSRAAQGGDRGTRTGLKIASQGVVRRPAARSSSPAVLRTSSLVLLTRAAPSPPSQSGLSREGRSGDLNISQIRTSASAPQTTS